MDFWEVYCFTQLAGEVLILHTVTALYLGLSNCWLLHALLLLVGFFMLKRIFAIEKHHFYLL